MSPLAVHYIPIVTTLLTIPFTIAIGRRYLEHPERLHLLWWTIGVAAYGAGTLTESLTTLFGWHEPIFRAWYMTGALLGGAPLAQGTVYLMLPRRTAHALTILLVLVIGIASAAVLASPINFALVEPHHLTGRVFEWTWVRRFSPFINLYAVLFLIGGAVVSAVRFSRDEATRHRMWANVWIACGAILPGIGGGATRFGYTEVLYVAEVLGLLMMWRGYVISVRPAVPERSADRRAVALAGEGRPGLVE